MIMLGGVARASAVEMRLTGIGEHVAMGVTKPKCKYRIASLSQVCNSLCMNEIRSMNYQNIYFHLMSIQSSLTDHNIIF